LDDPPKEEEAMASSNLSLSCTLKDLPSASQNTTSSYPTLSAAQSNRCSFTGNIIGELITNNVIGEILGRCCGEVAGKCICIGTTCGTATYFLRA
jgi:hypothetical protein